MPTSVSLARQCLTPEAAHALNEAVSVARRRGHAQTTSLHVVSAMLSLPSTLLRDACERARNSGYSARLQFKALELCLSVSLDRVPSMQLADHPPVSNSLMAAIKRSQANQRRQPENFQLYQQLQQQSSSYVSCIKVELQHLILSILDDPVVNRVFGEAGFRSCDIKLAIVRPLPQLLRCSRFRVTPMFLCNFIDSDPGRRNLNFPCSGFLPGEENCKRIGEVLRRRKGRNPLLVGVCAYAALQSFTEMVEKGRYNLPVEISGLSIIRIEKDVSKFFNEKCDQGMMNSKFEEVEVIIQHFLGAGLVVNYGDLKVFSDRDDTSDGVVSHVVSQLTRLLEIHGGKVRLMGAASSYETYLKFLNRYPSIEKGWDLQLLPITSLRPPMGEAYGRSSLMESFVPLGGFYSSPGDLKGQLHGLYQFTSRCHHCNEKYEHEVAALSKEGGFTTSAADQYQPNPPSWLQMTELGKDMAFEVAEAEDDGMVLLSAKIVGLQKKWDNICLRLHHTQSFSEADFYPMVSEVPSVVGFQIKETKENADNHSSSKTNASPSNSGCKRTNSCLSMDLQKVTKNGSFLPKLYEKCSRTEYHEPASLQSHSLSTSSVGDGWTSPTSVNSVTTELGLGMFSQPNKQLKKVGKQTHLKPLPDSSCHSLNIDLENGTISNPSSSCSCPDCWSQFDKRDIKTIFSALSQKIDCQHEAVSVICGTIARCQLGGEKCRGASPKGDTWLNFVGPDRFSKKKISVALAEILYGRRENFICMDLGSQDGMIHKSTNYGNQEMNGCNVNFRGKTVVDYIAGELSKKPLSVVFLENVDRADALAQNSLSHAISSGKFCDSHGREISINNATFVTTSRVRPGEVLSSAQEPTKYSEERISKAKRLPMQILVGYSHRDDDEDNFSHRLSLSTVMNSGIPNPNFLNKRELVGSSETLEQTETLEPAEQVHKASNTYLDLNIPAEENEGQDTDYVELDRGDSGAWLQYFSDQIDATVVFKPFDFDALAEKVMREMSRAFHETVGAESSLEIDPKVMEQILAAECSSDRTRTVGDWVEQVLRRGFAEAQKRYNLTSHSVVKLVPCEEIFMEDQAAGVWLPSRIILN